MIDNLFILFLVVGLTSIGVIYYFNYLLKHVIQVLMQLTTIQSEKFDDIEEFIFNAKRILKDIGVENILYELSYSDKELLHTEVSNTSFAKVEKQINDNLVKGKVCLEVKTNRGEKMIINSIILNILVMQILNFIHTKIRIINENFIQIAKMQTYMAHDLKNILQFFQVMQYNVDNIKSDEEKSRFIEFLQNSTEPINQKVNKILTILKTNSLMTFEKHVSKSNSFASFFEQYAKRYSLKCSIEGDVMTDINPNYLQTIINNILENIADKKVLDTEIEMHVIIEKREDTLSIEIRDSGTPFVNIQKLGEPFYTTKQEGTGIGFYQVYTVIRLLNGTMKCENRDNKPSILITLPK